MADVGTALSECDVLIVGGGLAGLSAAFHTLERGFSGTLVIIEPRAVYTRDRTWCFWSGPAGDDPADVLPQSVRRAVRWEWPTWRVTGQDGQAVVRSCPGWRYCGLPADAFHDAVLPILSDHPQVAWFREYTARDVTADGATIDGPGGRVRVTASTVVDTRPPASYVVGDGRATPERVRPGGTSLLQQFAGAEFEGDFDDVATLMDFAATDGRGRRDVSFLYVLPTGGGRALVEWTGMALQTLPPDEAWARLASAAVRALPGCRMTGRYRESGVLPMASGVTRPADGVVRMGVQGGACRPSTGYAFLHTQRQAAALARALVAGRTGVAAACAVRRETRRPSWLAYLDGVFLRRMARRPETFPAIFARLFARVTPDRLARFLADVPRLADGVAVVAAMPKMHFAFEATAGRFMPVRASAALPPTRDVWATHQRWAVGATAAVAAAALLAGGVPMTWQVGLLVVAATVGMTHGATDVWVGRDVFGGDPAGRRRFGGLYVAAAAAALLAYVASPVAWLAGFLVLSAVHFGFGELPGLLPRSAAQGVACLTRGLMPVTLPALLHADDVSAALGLLAGEAVGGAFAGVLATLASFVVAGVVALAVARAAARDGWGVLELAAVFAVLVALPPLVAFAVYFAVWHSLRHVLSDVVAALGGEAPADKPLLPVVTATLLPVAAAAVAWVFLTYRPASTFPADAAAVRVVFVTLGCLTVPHMALVLAAARRASNLQPLHTETA